MAAELRIATMLLAAALAAAAPAAQPAPVAPDLATPIAPPIEEVDLVSLADLAGRMTVPVHINGAGPFRFVVDTGADRTVVSDHVAARLALPPAPGALLHGITGAERVAMARVDGLELAGMRMAPFDAAVIGQGTLGAHGLLGIDGLADRRIEIDLKAGSMAIVPSRQKLRRPDADSEEIVVTARRRDGQLIITEAEFRRHHVEVVLDTGAEVSIGNLAMLDLLRRKTGNLELGTVIGVTGQTAEVRTAVLPELTVGAIRLSDAPVAFADLHCFARFGMIDRPALLLGMDVLRRFDHVSIDFRTRRVVFSVAREG